MNDPDNTANTDRPSTPDADLFSVVLVNDSFNTFDEAIKALRAHVPECSDEQAKNHAFACHENGVAVLWTGKLDRARAIHASLLGHRLHAEVHPANQIPVPIKIPSRRRLTPGNLWLGILIGVLAALLSVFFFAHPH